jgi:hypothetical protein
MSFHFPLFPAFVFVVLPSVAFFRRFLPFTSFLPLLPSPSVSNEAHTEEVEQFQSDLANLQNQLATLEVSHSLTQLKIN